jgi:hypothetical protein
MRWAPYANEQHCGSGLPGEGLVKAHGFAAMCGIATPGHG